MSVYAINKICHDALHNLAFRDALKSDPAAAIAPLPLTGDERKALLAGDIARLYGWGCHPYLLGHLTRWGIFGLTVQNYSERIRTAAGG